MPRVSIPFPRKQGLSSSGGIRRQQEYNKTLVSKDKILQALTVVKIRLRLDNVTFLCYFVAEVGILSRTFDFQRVHFDASDFFILRKGAYRGNLTHGSLCAKVSSSASLSLTGWYGVLRSVVTSSFWHRGG